MFISVHGLMALDFYIRAAGESPAVLCGTFLGADRNPGEEVLTAAKGALRREDCLLC